MLKNWWEFSGDTEEPSWKVKLLRVSLGLSMYILVPSFCLILWVAIKLDKILGLEEK